MHIVERVIDKDSNYKRNFAVCTSNPLRYIKEGVPFLEVNESPFNKKTYIRLDPIYSILNIKIKAESRIIPSHRLEEDTEVEFFKRVNGSREEHLDKQEFVNRNRKYTIEI